MVTRDAANAYLEPLTLQGVSAVVAADVAVMDRDTHPPGAALEHRLMDGRARTRRQFVIPTWSFIVHWVWYLALKCCKRVLVNVKVNVMFQ